MKKLENKREILKFLIKIQLLMKLKWKLHYTIEILACSDTLREVLWGTLFLRRQVNVVLL